MHVLCVLAVPDVLGLSMNAVSLCCAEAAALRPPPASPRTGGASGSSAAGRSAHHVSTVIQPPGAGGQLLHIMRFLCLGAAPIFPRKC